MVPDYSTLRSEHWLTRRPGVISDLVSPDLLARISLPSLMAASQKDVKVDRYFGDTLPDAADRVRLPRPEQAPLVMQQSRQRGRPDIFYFFGLVKTWPAFQDVINAVPIEYRWRYYTDLGSLSLPGSRIHAHADLIDTLIIQLTESRRWQVWAPTTDSVLIDSLNRNGDVPRLHPEGEPLMDIGLQPGSALYIPALWPHSAVTASDGSPSFSISAGWTGLTPLRLLHGVCTPSELAALQMPETRCAAALAQLLPDPPSGKDYCDWLVQHLYEALPSLSGLLPARAELSTRIRQTDLGQLATQRISTAA